MIGKSDDLYEIDRPEKLAERISFLLAHPEEADTEREMFYRRYKDNYTIDRNIEGHIKLYDELF